MPDDLITINGNAPVIMERLAPLLRPLGYVNVKRATFKRRRDAEAELLSVKLEDPRDELGLTKHPAVELYCREAWATGPRDEAFLLVWNWIGMTGPVKAVCDQLVKSGVRARVTTRGKQKGVAFSLADLKEV